MNFAMTAFSLAVGDNPAPAPEDIVTEIQPPTPVTPLPGAPLVMPPPPGAADRYDPVAPVMLPMNPTPSKLSMAEIERLAYELTMLPEGEAAAMATYHIDAFELAMIKQSPLYVQSAAQALKTLEHDPLAAVRLIARAALPSVVAALHKTATNAMTDDKDKTAAAKVLIDLAEPGTPAAKAAAKGMAGAGVTINFGVAVNAAVKKSWDA